MSSRVFSQSADFTTTTSSPIVSLDGNAPIAFSLSVNETGGTATSWTVVLESSLDGVNFTTLITQSRTDGVGTQKFPASAIPTPCNFLRTRCTGVALNTATKITASFVAV